MGAARALPSESRLMSKTTRVKKRCQRPPTRKGLVSAMPDKTVDTIANVLIVDGDRNCAELYSDHLERRGYRTSIATPKDMLDALARFNATVVLCDIEGPDRHRRREPRQGRIPGQDQPRAENAFERDHRLFRADDPRCSRPLGQQPIPDLSRGYPQLGPASLGHHQRHP